MKKLLLSLMLCFAAATSLMAQTFAENLVISINGESTPEIPAKIDVIDNGDGTCNFVLNNFKLEDGESSLPIGTIQLNNVPMTAQDGYTSIATTQTINILPGDDPTVAADEWMGPLLGDVPIVLSGCFNATHLYANIDIDMMDVLEQIINVKVGNEDAVTAIQSVIANSSAKQTIYSLDGRRLQQVPAKGFYMVNGKKCVK